MNDSVSILAAVFLILVALRWMLGGPQQGSANNQNQHRAQQRRPQHRATPQMVEMVRAVFPDIPQAAIIADLQRTGSVEATIDNALRDGGLPMPSPPATQSQSSNTSSSSTATQKTPTYSNLLKRYHIDESRDGEDLVEPPKVWETDAQKRQEMLRKRKEYMVLQARKKLLEKQTKSAASPASEGTSATSETAKNNYEEMSVEQLNHLTPEERRRHLLDALERKKSASNDSMQ